MSKLFGSSPAATPSSKKWSFLLPDTGVHEFRVEELGKKDMHVLIDGQVVSAPKGTTMFTGPGGSLLELRPHDSHWELYVNGLMVEEYCPGKREGHDDTLRNLKSRPDGAYTIATTFDSSQMDLRSANLVRKFRFTCKGDLHAIDVMHKDWVWQVVHNGQIVDRLSHSWGDEVATRNFKIDVDGMKVDVELLMSWDTKLGFWRYTCTANRIRVPACWTKTQGELRVEQPEVMGALAAEAAEVAEAAAEVTREEALEQDTGPVVPMVLPQGVSYDSTCGAYQANIRVHNKFLFLGEFATVEEAEMRYNEEAAKLARAT